VTRRRDRGRKLDPILQAFLKLAEQLDLAQRALLTAIPTSRNPGRPLDVALDEFELGLANAERLMPGWLTDETREWHARCSEDLASARNEAAALRAAIPEGEILQFELLNSRIGDMLHPLEEFADAERFLRKRKPN